MSEWQVFQGKKSAADTKEPMITIQRGGSLGLNKSAWRLLGQPERVVYLSDGSSRRFGIKKAEKDTPNSYPLRAQSGGSSFVVSAKMFLTWAGIEFGEQVRRFPLKLENGSVGVVEIETS